MLYLALFTGFSTVFALAAFVVSLRNIALPKRRLGEIDLQLGDIEHDINSLRSTIRRLNARVGMRDARDKKSGNGTPEPEAAERDPFSMRPGESPEEWKRRMRQGPLRAGIAPK